MEEPSRGETLLENADLKRYPERCSERSHAQTLEILPGPSSDQMGMFLEAAGWVKLPSSGSSTRYVPPLAGYVAKSLRSCLTDSESARKMMDPRPRRLLMEPFRILDAPSGQVQPEIPTVHPRALVVSMAKRILASTNPSHEVAKQAISEWAASAAGMLSNFDDDLASVGGTTDRADTHRGEFLVSADRQTGSLSFLPTGKLMGHHGPYAQGTKIYDPKKRKVPLAVVFHAGSAVKENASSPAKNLLEKDLFPALRAALARELLKMPPEDFASSMGPESLRKIRSSCQHAEALALEALAASATRLRAGLEKGATDESLRAASLKLVEEMDKFESAPEEDSLRRSPKAPSEKPLTHPLDILLPAASTMPWIFPAYASTKKKKEGLLHLHGLSGELFEGIFSAMESSRDFVLHAASTEEYDRIYRHPLEETIRGISRELETPSAIGARRALQRARTEMIAASEEGSVGFLELIRGRGILLPDGRTLPPIDAMRTLLGPGRDHQPDDETLIRISEKIEGISAALSDSKQSSGIGSIRDFCTKISKKAAIAKEFFGEEPLEALLSARNKLKDAEKAAGSEKENACGAERLALQSAVSDCLCACFFGKGIEPDPSHRNMVERLVSVAANSEFIYFAVQAGAEGLLKIGKAVDIQTRMTNLSKEGGYDVMPLAYIAIPGLPVGDWSMNSVAAAAHSIKPSARRPAVTAVNRLTGLFGSVESGGAADFFINAVNRSIEAKQVSEAGEWLNKRPEQLSREEVVLLLTESGQMRRPTAEAVHELIAAVHSPPEGRHGILSVQKGIREASAKVLSHLAAEVVWTRIPSNGVDIIREKFFAIDESTQMPALDAAWSCRIQSGALAAETMFHRKYSQSRDHGEWFHLLPAAESLVAEAERLFSTPAVRCNTKGGSLLPLISELQSSGMQVCTNAEMLPPKRDGYEQEISRVTGLARAAQVAECAKTARLPKFRPPARASRTIG